MRRITGRRFAAPAMAVAGALVVALLVFAGGQLAPVVEGYGPTASKDVAADAPISITFDRSMLEPTVERALRIEPRVDGSFSWQGNTVLFTPRKGWERGTEYTVSLDQSARSLSLAPLRKSLSYRFVTAGNLAVATVQPADGATDVAVGSLIAVQFSYPVVALGTKDESSPLRLDPPLNGKGRWLTTSLYLYQPDGGLTPGTRYVATILTGLKDTGGSALAADYSWSFSTKGPSVAKVTPEANTRFVALQPTIDVTFDQPVEHSSAEKRFALKAGDGSLVAGTTVWEGEALVFKPNVRLKSDTVYTASLATGVKAAGGVGDGKAFDWQFTTVGLPGVASTVPLDGQDRQPANSPLRIDFKTPMNTDSVEKNLSISPAPPQQWRANWQDSDTRMLVWGGLQPSTAYTLTIGAGAVDRFGQKLAEPLRLTFTTAPLAPRANLSVPGFVGTFNAAGSPAVYVDHVNVSRLDLALYRIDRSTLLSVSKDYRGPLNYSPPDSDLVRRWSVTPSSMERDKVVLTKVALEAAGGKLPAGFYFLKLTTPETSADSRLLVLSRLGLTMKRSDGQVLIWATDLTSSSVVPSLPIRIVDDTGKTLATGNTDADGLLLAPGVPLSMDVGRGRQMVPIYAFAEGAGDAGAVGSEWTQGINAYQFNIPWQPMTQQYRGYLFTERPIYRPGQKVLFKGIVRADDDARYSLPPTGSTVDVEIFDNRGRKVLSEQAKLSDTGSFDGELPLSTDAPLGSYRISARIGDSSFGVGFAVAEYRKPEFNLELSTEQRSYVHGDQIPVTGVASYYFGQPMASARLKWQVISRNYIFSAPSGRYQFFDSDLLREVQTQGERVRQEGETTTDKLGHFSFQVPADLSQDPLSQQFSIEATLTDANNQQVTARSGVIVHKGEYYAGLRPAAYVVKAGDAAAVEMVAVDKDAKPAPGVPIALSFYSRKWLSVKERQPDGSYVWNSKPEDTLLATQTVTTDASGRGEASLQVKNPGSMRVVAEVVDPKGNRTRSATYLFVSGSSFASWSMENNDRLQLEPDKKEYAVGDTARVLIPSPIAGATALITVERGKAFSHRVIQLHGNSDIVEIPIQPDYLPNVYVSAVLFKGAGPSDVAPSFRVGYGKLNVAVDDRALAVSVTPDRQQYQPGGKATFTIKTTGASGNGVPAEVSLAVVDASVLALADNNSGDLMTSFWFHRALGVSTSATLGVSVDRHNADLATGKKGAGGGAQNPTVRQLFPDTALWNPSIRTDASGGATVTMTMPDTLTTWRVMAWGATAATQVGSGSVDVVTTKSLLLRPAFPRFLLMGDHLKLSALLHNYSDRDVEAEIDLAAKGMRPETGTSFAPLQVAVKPGSFQKLEWPAIVDDIAGNGAQATLTLTAKPRDAGIPGDSVAVTLPVKPLVADEVVATSGEVRDSTTEVVRLPQGANPRLGELTVETSPSLAAGMSYSARFLDEFPYECIEQTISRFLPRVLMQRAFDKIGLPDRNGLGAELPGIVQRSIQKLYAAQRPEGGWGWWPGDQADQWITAYAVQGLAEARRSGFTVDQGVLDRAAQFLRQSLDAPFDAAHPENPNSRAYVLYALAVAGRGDLGLTNALYDRRSILAEYGKAYLLLALHSLGAGPEDTKIQALASDLASSVVASATGSHWEEGTVDYRTMNTDLRSTVVVLDALLKGAPDSPLIPSTVRWLMVARKDGHWATTQETAASLLALTDYLQASGELKGSFGYRVSLNGRDLAAETVSRDTLDESKKLVVAVKDLLAGQANLVNIARAVPEAGQTGDGKLYYTMNLRYFLPGDQVPATSNGLALMREYYRPGDEAAGPLTSVAAGETVKVKLTVVTLQDMHYLIVEDPLPAGLEAVNTTLKTTSQTATWETGGSLKESRPGPAAKQGMAKAGPAWWRFDYFARVEPRDDRVSLFASYLPRGTYEYTYLAQATTAGQFQALPTSGYEMYFPEVNGRGDGSMLTVRD